VDAATLKQREKQCLHSAQQNCAIVVVDVIDELFKKNDDSDLNPPG
jgi:hypothetical protein